ncbi:hypothetical protein Gotri_000631 [Gossypium trilobum]|uniref:Scarecrow-like protein 32 n=2 Tax=Gossypium TaxID=3633 RepID=A0A7J9KAB1_9ROSI|nr:hypothetical protein [Gossypium trilobum]MBA0843189.1 hypothetical protein [Gossypium armourianum]
MKTEVRGNGGSISLQNPSLFNTPLDPITGALKGCLGSLDGACIEKLLLHCASALENNDVTLAQQVMWVLNNVASTVGDTNQRLTAWFLRALISRASRAVEGYGKVHILDFSITHCMQWPTLIDALAKRPEGPPSLRITVPSCRPQVPPLLNVSKEEVGHRLANFAKFRDVPFEFHVKDDDPCLSNETFATQFESLLTQLTRSQLDLRDDEALVINCQNWLRYLSDETKGNTTTVRDAFLDVIKGLNPRIIVVVDEDCDLSASSLSSRITTCFNYLWIPFDALETFLPKDSRQRLEYESDIGHKIENIVGFEGFRRTERLESGVKLSQRINDAGFVSLPFCEDTINEVKSLLDEHASGWGMKREEDMLVLTWKGHNSVFATAWTELED